MSDTQPHSTELEREETIRDLEVPARARPVVRPSMAAPPLG
jgi:hypothetical protein